MSLIQGVSSSGQMGVGVEDKLASGSPPVTPLERQRLLADVVVPPAELPASSPEVREGDMESSGVATPDRVDETASSSSSADALASKKLAGRNSKTCCVGVQVEQDAAGLEPSAAEAARCLRVALRFTQQQARNAPKPSARLAAAIGTLATFVETQAAAQAAAERARAHAAKRPNRIVRHANVKPASDASIQPDAAPKPKAAKDGTQKLTAAEKRLLEQKIPETFVVSDAISAKTVGASDLSTPRFKAASAISLSEHSEADHSHLEDTSDTVFEAMHRPRERNERAAHKEVFQATRAQPGRSPRAGPAGSPRASPRAGAITGGQAHAVVAPLTLAGPEAQSSTAEPDDWEVLGRRNGTNQIVLRKLRKRRAEDAGERERKLLRAAVFANVGSN